MNVIKRDLTISEYDLKKIENALKLAFKNSNTECKDINFLTNIIHRDIMEKKNNNNIEIESIQNIVEKNLMKAEYYDTAKHYIEYRK